MTSTDCTIEELLEHRRQLIRANEKLCDVIDRARTELLEIRDGTGGGVLGDYDIINMRVQVPKHLSEYSQDLLFRSIEILDEV